MILSKNTGVQEEKTELKLTIFENILKNLPGVTLHRDIDARNLTSFCIGGKVDYLVTIENIDSVSPIIREIHKSGLKMVIIGAGTNILVSDKGFRGVFLHLEGNLNKIERISDSVIKAGAAVRLSELITYLRDNQLGGLSFLSGIPGSLGGAIAMNAGAFGGEMCQRILEVRAVNAEGDELTLKGENCCFGYRTSKFLAEGSVALEVTLEVIPETNIDAEVEGFLEHRKKRHDPKGKYAGSVFKNPENNYAGKILDESGMRGLRIGSAYVSDNHANFILADDNASAEDVLELMKIAAFRAYTFYGIKLYPEIRLIGFDLDWHEIFDN